MPLPDDATRAEQFHLAFLHVLGTAVRPADYVLKGGVNLRYFFGSVRYSQDIDLDVIGGAGWRLEEAVDRVLIGRALTLLLHGPGLTVVDVAKPKQTDTTRRWTLGLQVAGRSVPIRTKIEFSGRRGDEPPDERFELRRVSDTVVQPYGVVPPVVQRYSAPSMVEQKVAALALRSETKARDVFDLDLLLRERARSFPTVPLLTTHVQVAIARARELTDASFEAQVLPFLDPSVVPLYTAPGAWAHLRHYVADQLDDLRQPLAVDEPGLDRPRTPRGPRLGGGS